MESKYLIRKRSNRLFSIYVGMISRCYYEKDIAYKYYGGKGVRVCDRWRESFEAFVFDVIDTYKDGLTLGRIRNNEDYSPSNFEWSTMAEQSVNKSNTRLVLYNGDLVPLASLAKKSKISLEGIKWRLSRGWDIESALNTPPANTRACVKEEIISKCLFCGVEFKKVTKRQMFCRKEHSFKYHNSLYRKTKPNN